MASDAPGQPEAVAAGELFSVIVVQGLALLVRRRVCQTDEYVFVIKFNLYSSIVYLLTQHCRSK